METKAKLQDLRSKWVFESLIDSPPLDPAAVGYHTVFQLSPATVNSNSDLENCSLGPVFCLQ